MVNRLVLTTAVGKKRLPFRGLLLTIVTFGLYRYYWIYKAPTEVYKQFELDREGRDDSVVWLILGILLPFLILVYDWKAVENVRYARARLGLTGGVTPAKFTFLPIGVAGLGVVLFVAAGVILGASLEGDATDADAGAAYGRAVPLYVIGGLVFVVALGVNVWTYFAFQKDINGVWDAWAARVHELATPAAPTPVATAPVAAVATGTPGATSPRPPAPTGERYTCPSCTRSFLLPKLPAPGTLCPTCRAR